jgi:hypothetical protein
MTNQTPHSRAQYNRQIEHWNRQLYNQVPLVGALVRRSAANELAAAARGHATLADQYLALAVARVPDPKV